MNGNGNGRNYEKPAGAIAPEEHLESQPASKDNRAVNKIPLLSYFTGAGFLDIGFAKSNFDIIWRNEKNPHFARGFQYGMAALHNSNTSYPVNTTSILGLKRKTVEREAFNGLGKPETFGMIGGPPCPDFAAGGKHRGGEGDNGRLTRIFVNHILALEPAFFVIENVFGLFKTRNHQIFFNGQKKRLEERYWVDASILNALDYGVPQHRERGFLVGFRKDWLSQHTDLIPVAGGDMFGCVVSPKFKEARTRFEWPGRTRFGATPPPPKPSGIPDELMVGTHICDPADDLRELPNGLDMFRAYSDKFNRIDEGDDHRKSFKRLHRWRFSPAAAYGNNEVHLHPLYPRRLSVREVLRIQSVPDKYALPPDLTLTHKFKMAGNGVPVRLAEAVACSVVNFLQHIRYDAHHDEIVEQPAVSQHVQPVLAYPARTI